MRNKKSATETNGKHHLRVADRLLLAAIRLWSRTGLAFRLELLVLEAWRMYPQVFGLRGFDTISADSNRVKIELMHKTGLLRRGWLNKVGPSRYEITDAGRAQAEHLRTTHGAALSTL